MNPIDQLETKIAALTYRVSRIEKDQHPTLAEAKTVASEIGLDPDRIGNGATPAEYGRLCAEMRSRGWSRLRIMLALECCEKTVDRYLALSRQPSRKPLPKK